MKLINTYLQALTICDNIELTKEEQNRINEMKSYAAMIDKLKWDYGIILTYKKAKNSYNNVLKDIVNLISELNKQYFTDKGRNAVNIFASIEFISMIEGYRIRLFVQDPIHHLDNELNKIPQHIKEKIKKLNLIETIFSIWGNITKNNNYSKSINKTNQQYVTIQYGNTIDNFTKDGVDNIMHGFINKEGTIKATVHYKTMNFNWKKY